MSQACMRVHHSATDCRMQTSGTVTVDQLLLSNTLRKTTRKEDKIIRSLPLL
jgi:hypothetical protein